MCYSGLHALIISVWCRHCITRFLFCDCSFGKNSRTKNNSQTWVNWYIILLHFWCFNVIKNTIKQRMPCVAWYAHNAIKYAALKHDLGWQGTFHISGGIPIIIYISPFICRNPNPIIFILALLKRIRDIDFHSTAESCLVYIV